MGFIRLFPLPEIHPVDPARFGYGDPARVHAIARFAAPEWVVGVGEIWRYEDCPLYIVSPEEPNALVDGVRLQLRSGDWLVVANDSIDEAEQFEGLLEAAMSGRVVTLPFSLYLRGGEAG